MNHITRRQSTIFVGLLFLFLLLACSLFAKTTPEKPEDWVTITSKYEGQTATEICREAGYSTAVSAKRCDGTIFTFPETFSHVNCKPGANKYQDCFDFNACSREGEEGVKGVLFDAIYCKQ